MNLKSIKFKFPDLKLKKGLFFLIAVLQKKAVNTRN